MDKPVRVSYQEMYVVYHKALDSGATMKTVIQYKGMEFLMGYLKYLLQHMKNTAEQEGTVDDTIFTFVPNERDSVL